MARVMQHQKCVRRRMAIVGDESIEHETYVADATLNSMHRRAWHLLETPINRITRELNH